MRFWRHTPPPALALKRLSLFVGMKPEKPEAVPVSTARDAAAEVAAGGLPVSQGRPNDPMLDLVGW